MVAVVVAFLIRFTWYVVSGVLDHGDAPNRHMAALSFGLLIAVDLVIAAAAASTARRLTGIRRIGAWVFACGYIAMAARLCVPEVQGASALDVVTIAGLAVAAGGRGAWLALPAFGLVLVLSLATVDGKLPQVDMLYAVKALLCAGMASGVERYAKPPEPDRERGIAGMRWLELLAWLTAGLSVIVLALRLVGEVSAYSMIPVAFIGVVLNVIVVTAVWSIARARVDKLPRWPWYVSATCTLWAIVRTVRVWGRTITHRWGHLDDAKLTIPHWSVAVPGLLSTVAILAALAVFARRSSWPKLGREAIVAAVFVVLAFAVRIDMPEESVAVAACYIAVNAAMARVVRTARQAAGGPLPRARVQRA